MLKTIKKALILISFFSSSVYPMRQLVTALQVRRTLNQRTSFHNSPCTRCPFIFFGALILDDLLVNHSVAESEELADNQALYDWNKNLASGDMECHMDLHSQYELPEKDFFNHNSNRSDLCYATGSFVSSHNQDWQNISQSKAVLSNNDQETRAYNAYGQNNSRTGVFGIKDPTTRGDLLLDPDVRSFIKQHTPTDLSSCSINNKHSSKQFQEFLALLGAHSKEYQEYYLQEMRKSIELQQEHFKKYGVSSHDLNKLYSGGSKGLVDKILGVDGIQRQQALSIWNNYCQTHWVRQFYKDIGWQKIQDAFNQKVESARIVQLAKEKHAQEVFQQTQRVEQETQQRAQEEAHKQEQQRQAAQEEDAQSASDQNIADTEQGESKQAAAVELSSDACALIARANVELAGLDKLSPDEQKEIIDLLNRAAQEQQAIDPSCDEAIKATVQVADAACQAFGKGCVKLGRDLISFGNSVLDCTVAFSKGLVHGVGKSVQSNWDALMHPVDTLTGLAKGVAHMANLYLEYKLDPINKIASFSNNMASTLADMTQKLNKMSVVEICEKCGEEAGKFGADLLIFDGVLKGASAVTNLVVTETAAMINKAEQGLAAVGEFVEAELAALAQAKETLATTAEGFEVAVNTKRTDIAKEVEALHSEMSAVDKAKNASGSVEKTGHKQIMNAPKEVDTRCLLEKNLEIAEKAKKDAVRIEMLSDGRIRYYEAEKAARTPGPTRGSSYVVEYDPRRGVVRSWYESYDQAGNVNRVRPKMINGQKIESLHYPHTGKELIELAKQLKGK